MNPLTGADITELQHQLAMAKGRLHDDPRHDHTKVTITTEHLEGLLTAMSGGGLIGITCPKCDEYSDVDEDGCHA